MAADLKKIARIYRLLTLVQGRSAGPGWSQPALAEELDVSAKTLRGYVKELRTAGIPLVLDADRIYRTEPSHFLPPIDFTAEEALSLLLLCEAPGSDVPGPDHPQAIRAAHKLRAHLPAPIRDLIDTALPQVSVAHACTEPAAAADLWSNAFNAIAAGRKMHARYAKKRGDPALALDAATESFTLCPFALTFQRRAWYLIARTEGRAEYGREDGLRTFRLTRFEALRATDERYVLPADFSLHDYFDGAWRMIPGNGRQRVVLTFDADRADTVDEVWWHQSQETERRPGGRLRVTFQVNGLTEIDAWILGYGSHVVVEEPAELRERVVGALKAAAARYDSGEDA